jgi:hypothetical protein
MQIMTMAFVCALAVATLAPAPARNADGLLLSLLATVFLAVVVMGVLALLDVLTGTAILAAIGASIMVPCAWLARAPGRAFEDAGEDDDDGGGGSPPYEPSSPHGPDDRRPRPTRAPVFSFAMSPQAPAGTPALAPAGPRAELPPVAAVPSPNPRPLNPRFPLIVTAPWSEPRPPVVLTPPADLPLEPARDPGPRRPRLRRGDHRSIAHRRAAGRHAARRRRGVMRLRLLHGWRRLACVADAEPTTPVDAQR